MAEARRTFGPVVLAGLASAILATVAATRPWVEGSSGRVDTGASAYSSSPDIVASQESPLAAALALVVLATWGVVLVTRGRFSRAVALLGAVAGIGLGATAVVGFVDLQDQLGRALLAASGTDTVATRITGWWVAALAGAVVSSAAAVAAVRFAPSWPEMGSRYDAPAGAGAAQHPDDADQGNLELWRAIDEGRDPTE